MKKTKLTRSMLAACSIVALSAVMYGCVHNGDDSTQTGTEVPEPMEGMSVDVTMDVALGAAEQAALVAVLPNPGDSDTLTVAAGGMATRADVVFSCDSAYPCTFTLTNNLDTIVASVSTQKLADAGDPMATAMVPPGPMDTFAEFNDGSIESIRNDVGAQDGTTTPPDLDPTELIGMGIGGPGALDASMAALRSIFDPNGADFGDAPGNAAAAPGLSPTLTMGSTISGAMRPDGDGIPASDDMAMAPHRLGHEDAAPGLGRHGRRHGRRRLRDGRHRRQEPGRRHAVSLRPQAVR